jgi:hypothetical protein
MEPPLKTQTTLASRAWRACARAREGFAGLNRGKDPQPRRVERQRNASLR